MGECEHTRACAQAGLGRAGRRVPYRDGGVDGPAHVCLREVDERVLVVQHPRARVGGLDRPRELGDMIFVAAAPVVVVKPAHTTAGSEQGNVCGERQRAGQRLRREAARRGRMMAVAVVFITKAGQARPT